MILVSQDDVLRGLKKFKRLAKQDLLVSPFTSDPDFWSNQAEGRRHIYTELMEIIKKNGVDQAYDFAMEKYANLPFLIEENNVEAKTIGEKQSFEMFFTLLGLDKSRYKRKPMSKDETLSIKIESF